MNSNTEDTNPKAYGSFLSEWVVSFSEAFGGLPKSLPKGISQAFWKAEGLLDGILEGILEGPLEGLHKHD